jgi:hypothetical protein
MAVGVAVLEDVASRPTGAEMADDLVVGPLVGTGMSCGGWLGGCGAGSGGGEGERARGQQETLH